MQEAFTACNEVLKAEPNNIEALCDRAETYILDEQFEKGEQEIKISLRKVNQVVNQ